jgi:predicted nucleotidyltransferase
MKFGLDDQTISRMQDVFRQFPTVEKVIIYGSRAKGNYRKGSDIDLTLLGKELDQQLCSDIAEALDDLLLPYMIDLSVYDLLNHQELEEHIKRVGQVFYEKKQNQR